LKNKGQNFIDVMMAWRVVASQHHLSKEQLVSAAAQFAAMPPGCKREYCDWIAEAKRDETREKRVATAIEWIAEGKRRNWKYENC